MTFGVALASTLRVRAELSADLDGAAPGTCAAFPRQTVFWLLVCFTCSGMSGLIYEISWVRSLELIFGATTFAVATVLASFMGGLAGGSYWMGKMAARFEKLHPLRVYALIECLIGVVAILIPLSFQAIVPAYQWFWRVSHASFLGFSLIRFLLSALILVIPTFLMGATLPIVSNFVSREPALGKKRIGLLYSFNTLGAVLGCVAAGLVLFPGIGLAKTQWVAVGLNAVAAAGAFLIAARTRNWRVDGLNDAVEFEPMPALLATKEQNGILLGNEVEIGAREKSTSQQAEFLAPGSGRLLVAIYAFSGFVAMLYEVAWNRALVMVLGSSTYAYTIMLATFLFGLALGAWLATRFVAKSFSPLLASGLCQIGIAVSTLLSVLLVEEMPYLYIKFYEALHPGATGLLNIQFVMAFALMILPTLGLGAMFPITIRGLNSGGAGAGREVGWAYALNTVGAIAGSVMAGFWFVPTFGSEKTLLSGIALNTVLGMVAILPFIPKRLALYRPFLATLVLLFSINLFYSVPQWDPAIMSSGVFRYVRQYAGLTRQGFRDYAQKITGEMLMFKEGLTCTVTVFRNPECISLLVNGKPDASTASGLNPITDQSPLDALHDLPTQRLLGQVPLLLAPRRDDVLLIGLGSGVTLGSVLTHPVKTVECIELEEAVVRGSRFFEEFNGRPLWDPRAQLVVNDARNHLLVTPRKYDVIISEPSNPWIPGAANLFTREFFEISKSKLQPKGLFCQWIQLYELQESHFQTILHTFNSVFPEAHLFRVKHDAILVGSVKPAHLRESELRSRFTPAVQGDLAGIQVRSLEDLIARYWIGGDELKRAIRNEPYNTDDNMLIQFAAPLQVLTDHSKGINKPLATIFEGRTSGAFQRLELDPSTDKALFWGRVGKATLRLGDAQEAMVYAETSWNLRHNPQAAEVLAAALTLRGEHDRAFAFLDEAERSFPRAPELMRALALHHSRNLRWKEARSFSERLLSEAPDDPVGLFCLGRSQFHLGESSSCLAVLEKIPVPARALKELDQLPFYLGVLYWQEKRYEKAIEQYTAFLKNDPAHIEARAQLADALYQTGNVSEAANQWQHIGRLNAAQANRFVEEARLASRSGKAREAAQKLEQAVGLDGNDSDLVLLLAREKRAKGDAQGAIKLLQDHLRWHPDRPLVVGYLSQLMATQKKPAEANLLAARYRALTGRAWEVIP